MHKMGLLDSLKAGLQRSREAINEIFYMGGEVDEDFWEDLEDTLVMGDMGAEVAMRVTDGLREQAARENLTRADQLRDALAYIEGYAIKRKTFKKADRPESDVIYSYPFKAIEEILSNAVYHRSYQINEPITVRITLEALEVTSFPGFDCSITDEDVKNHRFRARTYRNRRIGDFLKELRLIEGRNTGYPAVFAALAENGSPDPVFEMDENRGYLSVTLPVHPAFLEGRRASERTAQRERDYEQSIIETLGSAEHPLSMTELAHGMGYRGITKRLASTLDALVSRREVIAVPGASPRRVRYALPE